MKRILTLIALSLPISLQAGDGELLRVVLDKIKYEQWDNAKSFASHASDPMVREILDWYALRAGHGNFVQYQRFIKDNPDWPGMPKMLQFAESMMPDDLPALDVIALFGEMEPQSAKGLARLVKALNELNDHEKAVEALDEALKRIAIPYDAMKQIEALEPAWVRSNLYSHVNYLMLEKKPEIAMEYIGSLSAGQQVELAARIEVLNGTSENLPVNEEKIPKLSVVEKSAGQVVELAGNASENMARPAGIEPTKTPKVNESENAASTADAIVEKPAEPAAGQAETDAEPMQVPDTPTLAFEKFRYAFEHKNRKAARKILLTQSTSREALFEPEYWTQDDRRVRLAGDAIWEGNYQDAYDIASKHFLELEEDGYGEAEWKAGFIALEFLHDAKRARTHFTNYQATAKTPIALGRAGYWLGRAGDPTGYALGAKYQTSFYGQLAAEAGKLPQDMALINSPKASYANLELLGKASVHAGLLFAAAKEPLLADRFFRHQAETLLPVEAESLGQLAVDLKLPHAAVGIGKNLAERGEVIPNSYYPMPDIFASDIKVRPALAYSITRQESEFYQRAGSKVGAQGYMQLMPATAETMARDLGIPYVEKDLLDNGAYNIQLGTGYLAKVGARYENKIPYIAVGYNAGPNRVSQWFEHHGAMGMSVENAVKWVELIPFEETHNYVQRVLEGVYIYDGKLAGKYAYPPSDLLLKAYPLPQ